MERLRWSCHPQPRRARPHQPVRSQRHGNLQVDSQCRWTDTHGEDVQCTGEGVWWRLRGLWQSQRGSSSDPSVGGYPRSIQPRTTHPPRGHRRPPPERQLPPISPSHGRLLGKLEYSPLPPPLSRRNPHFPSLDWCCRIPLPLTRTARYRTLSCVARCVAPFGRPGVRCCCERMESVRAIWELRVV